MGININRYTRPTAYLPISLHDARVSALQIFPDLLNKQNGLLVFVFEDGIKMTNDSEIHQTGKAIVQFSDVDFESSRVNYCKENNTCEMSFERLAGDIQIHSFDILDEFYECNLSRLVGNMVTSDSWYEAEIEIYHFDL